MFDCSAKLINYLSAEKALCTVPLCSDVNIKDDSPSEQPCYRLRPSSKLASTAVVHDLKVLSEKREDKIDLNKEEGKSKINKSRILDFALIPC